MSNRAGYSQTRDGVGGSTGRGSGKGGRGGTERLSEDGRTVRQLKVGEELRHILSDLIRATSFRDSAHSSISAAVSEVRVSPDLKNATAYVAPLANNAVEDIIAILNRTVPFFRSQIGQKLRMKTIPKLFFVADTTLNQVRLIEEILRHPEVVKDLQRGQEIQADAPDDND